MPVVETRGLEHRGHGVGHNAIHRIMHVIHRSERAGRRGRRNALQQPHGDEHGDDDRARATYESPQAHEHRANEHDETRPLVWRQTHCERLGGQARELHLAQQDAHQQNEHNGDHIHEEHHKTRLLAEECIGEHHVHRQSRGAA